jgi:adsorption protein B
MGVIAAVLQFADLAWRELLLFAGIWFFVGLVDEIAVDLLWFWLRLRGRGKALPFTPPAGRRLRGPAAVLIPCWDEGIVEHTLSACRQAWPHEDCALYVGCYRNDPATLVAAQRGAGDDARVRIVVVPRDGPTTKADCLNALYEEMELDERRRGEHYRFVLLQDAEDQVHPLALDLIDDRLERADFVQLPVIPEANPRSRWIAGHYGDEFAESHLKTMVVRDWLRTALPAAGVGCAFRRDMLARIAEFRGADHPFAPECLTEDYELGLIVKALGGRSRFVRALDGEGRLIATREYFPATIGAAVRQKARWIHGIAFQGWERLGWSRGWSETWMRLRDRRGPLTALVLLAGYLVVVIWAITEVAEALGIFERKPLSNLLETVVLVGAVGLAWRALMRFAFTSIQYGHAEGLRAVLRLPILNIVTIVAARRALATYIRSLRGHEPVWDKTDHIRYTPSAAADAASMSA